MPNDTKSLRNRMADWLAERNEWARANGISAEYSRTSMAADVAPWLELDAAMALCERAGWPDEASKTECAGESQRG